VLNLCRPRSLEFESIRHGPEARGTGQAMKQFPQSTYRLQFHAGFTFADATAIVSYLAELGVSHVYASSYLRAKPGSTHGYDVIDHCRLNPELGTQADYDAFLAALAEHGMGHILDVVPNHVGVATNDNAWWNDVLLNGRASKYAKYFDIQWDASPRPELKGKVLLPVLGAPYGEVLEKGELKLKQEDGRWWVYYYDRCFPINGDVSVDLSVDELDCLLERQHYRLAYWRVASDEINYRRFFDINDLAGLAMEREEVFRDTHAFIMDLVKAGKVTGLRIDHPDGLYDPAAYLNRLQAAAGRETYVVVEKILATDEQLPADWACHGTSGYDFLNMVNGLFVDRCNEQTFTEIYQDITGDHTSYDDLVYENKRRILNESLASELHMLAWRLDRIAQCHRSSRDFTLNGLRTALREAVACFPVYRTYIASNNVSDVDRHHIVTAVECAIEQNPNTAPAVFHFIRDTLLNPADEAKLDFAGKFQQLTAPVTAKGIEDTTFYQYHRLISLNEVGGDPSQFGVSPERVHAYFTDRAKRWPFALSTLSTHDTKRSEDVRARINVLSEIPDAWRDTAGRWVKRMDIPADEAYLLLQTLIGTWLGRPDRTFMERIQAYMLKAIREAKLRTSWTDPDADHEAKVNVAVERLLRDEAFIRDFEQFHRRIDELGTVNSLAQTLLKLAAPGVPDTYQGSELPEYSLVDPDNRRPVDYNRRQAALSGLQEPKLRLHAEVLRLRRKHPMLFTTGEYVPIYASGQRAEHVFAFLRRDSEWQALVLVPRLTANLNGWDDTTIAVPAAMLSVFGGGPIAKGNARVGDLLKGFPVALLVSA
jgi:(1->4)-alpha-D-glucan 1-alpha-D-glucosylmutase